MLRLTPYHTACLLPHSSALRVEILPACLGKKRRGLDKMVYLICYMLNAQMPKCPKCLDAQSSHGVPARLPSTALLKRC